MNYQERIQQNQKFLLKLLNLHIGNYFPLRKWLGIDYKGEIQEITHLSFAYDTKYFKKGKKWFKQVTRTYQQPDLGYKLCQILDKIPQIVFLPAFLQPAYGLGVLAFFFLTETTYQPTTHDTALLNGDKSDTNFVNTLEIQAGHAVGYLRHSPMHWDISDIPDNAIFSQGDIILYAVELTGDPSVTMSRLTQIGWVETEATWNSYKTGSNWSSPGGDYTSTNAKSIFPTGSGWQTWSSKSLIQDCYDNQNKNVHIIATAPNESNHRWMGASKDYDTASYRPKLTVTYKVPSNFFPFFNS